MGFSVHMTCSCLEGLAATYLADVLVWLFDFSADRGASLDSFCQMFLGSWFRRSVGLVQ